MSAPVTPEALVDAILQPLGTKLANYMPVHRERALNVASIYLADERRVSREFAELLWGFVRNRAHITAEDPFDGPLSRLMDKAEAALAKAGL